METDKSSAIRITNSRRISNERHRRMNSIMESIKSSNVDRFASYYSSNPDIQDLVPTLDTKILSFQGFRKDEIPKKQVFHPPRKANKSA